MADAMVGLIAAAGRLPIIVAQGMRDAGVRICGVGLRGHYDATLPALCDAFSQAGVYRIGSWIRILRRHGVRQAIVVGRVSKGRMHDPLRLFRQAPDLRAVRLWYRRLRHDRRDAAVLGALADELASGGVTLIDSTTWIGPTLADSGTMTAARPSDSQARDVEVGRPLLRAVASLQIGQAVAVSRGRVVAIEAVEGTDALIERASRLAEPGWTLLKGPRAGHDMRADVPTVGVGTIEGLAAAGGGCLALAAGRVIMIDKAAVLAAADRAGIAVVGID